MIMSGIYNTETVEGLVNTIQNMHTETMWNER